MSKRQGSRLIEPRRSALAAAVSAAIASTTIASPAAAQTIEEIIVTATKRDESVREVPLAITALSGAFTEQVNLNDYYSIDAEALSRLDGESLEELNKQGALSLAFFALSSLTNIQRLITLKNRKSAIAQ